MDEPEYKEILDRTKHRTDVQQHFDGQLKQLVDLVNYKYWGQSKIYYATNIVNSLVFTLTLIIILITRLTTSIFCNEHIQRRYYKKREYCSY